MERSQLKIFLTKFVLGSAILSRAVTSTLPMVPVILPPENAWAAARRDFDVADGTPDVVALQPWLKQEMAKRPIAEVVKASYALPGVDRVALDSFWLDLAAAERDATIMEAVIAAKTNVQDLGPASREDFLAQWLVKTSSDCYGNCGNGNGNGGGNGTGNEGNGNGPGNGNNGNGNNGNGNGDGPRKP